MFSTVGASYSFTDGSATGGSDFDNTPGTISVGPQVAQSCLNVSITNDATPESAEVGSIHVHHMIIYMHFCSLSQ